MHELQQTKVVNLTPPGALVDDASLTVAELDTIGYNYLTIMLVLGATDIACSACKLTESDTTGTGHADISGADFDGDTESDGTTAALPSATDDDGVFAWELDLKSRERYIDATITVGDGTAGGYYSVVAILSRAKESPVTPTQRGLAGVLRV